MPAPANLVQEISTSAGLGDFTLAAADGRQTFEQAFIIGGTDVFDYFITSRVAGEWERGTGHLLNATTLVRDTIIESSNSDNPVTFSAGTKDVTNDVPADNQVLLDGTQSFTGVTGFEQPILAVNDVATPTDANADGAGFAIRGTVDKTITWSDGDEQIRSSDPFHAPVLAFSDDLLTPSGNWNAAGIGFDEESLLSFDNRNVIFEEGGVIKFDNIDQIDSTAKATIESAITALLNLTSVGALDTGSITNGFGDIDIGSSTLTATGTINAAGGSTWDNTGIDLSDGDSLSIAGFEMLRISGGSGFLSNITVLDQDTEDTIVAAMPSATTSLEGFAEFATSVEFQSNSTLVRALESNQVWDAQAEVALTSTSNSVAWDMDTGFNFDIDTLAENTTIANPTNTHVGKSGHLRIVQDGTGTRTVAFGSNFEFAGGNAPTASTDPAAEDMFFYKVISSTRILISSILDIS